MTACEQALAEKTCSITFAMGMGSAAMSEAAEAQADSFAGRWAVRSTGDDRLVAADVSHDVAVDVKEWLTSCFPSNRYFVEPASIEQEGADRG